MKRVLFLIVSILFLSCCFVSAKTDDIAMPFVKLNGSKFYLYYSAKSSETGGFINEYYKNNQTYTNWDELVGIHHYPTAFYPIEHAKEFKDYLNAIGSMAVVESSDENNSAMLYFVVISDKKLPIVLEFNVFKYVKSPLCGTVAFQYAKRYLLNNGLEVDAVIREFKKYAIKYVKQVEKVDMPDIITFEIDKGQYVHPEDIEKILAKQAKAVEIKKIKKEKINKKNVDKGNVDIDADVFAGIQEDVPSDIDIEESLKNNFDQESVEEYKF